MLKYSSILLGIFAPCLEKYFRNISSPQGWIFHDYLCLKNNHGIHAQALSHAPGLCLSIFNNPQFFHDA